MSPQQEVKCDQGDDQLATIEQLPIDCWVSIFEFLDMDEIKRSCWISPVVSHHLLETEYNQIFYRRLCEVQLKSDLNKVIDSILNTKRIYPGTRFRKTESGRRGKFIFSPLPHINSMKDLREDLRVCMVKSKWLFSSWFIEDDSLDDRIHECVKYSYSLHTHSEQFIQSMEEEEYILVMERITKESEMKTTNFIHEVQKQLVKQSKRPIKWKSIWNGHFIWSTHSTLKNTTHEFENRIVVLRTILEMSRPYSYTPISDMEVLNYLKTTYNGLMALKPELRRDVMFKMITFSYKIDPKQTTRQSFFSKLVSNMFYCGCSPSQSTEKLFEKLICLFVEESIKYGVKKPILLDGAKSVKFTSQTLAGGNPYGDSFPLNVASFTLPFGVAFSSNGDAYVSDMVPVVRRISNGTINRFVGHYTTGNYFSSGDGGPADEASFTPSFHATFDSVGNLYMVDYNGHLRVIYLNGTVDTLAGKGDSYNDYIPAREALLRNPSHVAIFNKEIYICEFARIRKILENGTIVTVAGTGMVDFSGDGGPATSAQLFSPNSIVFASNGDFFISDTMNNRIRKVERATGNITTIAGNGTTYEQAYSGDGGLATSAKLYQPSQIVMGPDGNLYFIDAGNVIVRMVNLTSGIISIIAGIPNQKGFNGDGILATSASLSSPQGLTFRSDGVLFVTDSKRIRMICNGVISTFAGNGQDFTGDGYPAVKSNLMDPMDVTTAPNGDSYILDKYCVIRKVNSQGIIVRVAGNGICGDSDPNIKAIDNMITANTIYYSSTTNSIYLVQSEAIFKWSLDTDRITHVAGTTKKYSGDGYPASSSILQYVSAINISPSGQIYLADTSSAVIRRVETNGIISTFAGNGVEAYNADKIAAKNASLARPMAIAVTKSGELYISDTANFRIRKVLLDGTIRTVAGNGNYGYSGDGGLATSAVFDYVPSIALSPNEDVLYVADVGNNRIRSINFTTGIVSSVVSLQTDPNQGYLGSIAVSPLTGELYLLESGYCVIKLVDVLTGNTSKVAGSVCGYIERDENSTALQLRNPVSLFINNKGLIHVLDGDASGTVYVIHPNGTVVDHFTTIAQSNCLFIAPNNDIYLCTTDSVKKISNGKITQFAGGVGDGGLALNAKISPQSVVVSKTGELIIADSSRIRRVDNNGIITTIGGNGESGYSGNGLPATESSIGKISGHLALSDDGEIYFADLNNYRVRKIAKNGSVVDLVGGTSDTIPVSVAVSQLGEVYLLNTVSGIERISKNGSIDLIVTKSELGPSTVHLSSNGSLIFVSNGNLVTKSTPYCEDSLILTENNQWCEFSCFGKVGNMACGGNTKGVCQSLDKCSCVNGWNGNECTIAQCGGLLATDKTVCSSRGICSSYNNCTCQIGYVGANCESERAVVTSVLVNFVPPNFAYSFICGLLFALILSLLL